MKTSSRNEFIFILKQNIFYSLNEARMVHCKARPVSKDVDRTSETIIMLWTPYVHTHAHTLTCVNLNTN